MVGHGQRETLNPDELGTLCGYLIHYNFSKGISAWVAKHARYARDEAAVALASAVEYNPLDLLRVQGTTERRRKLKAISQSLPLRPLARFLYVYVFRLGFLDGRAGLRYAILMAFYQWLIDLNIVERQQQANVG
jgi:hypothetical protein